MGRRSGFALRRSGVALAALAIVLSLFAIGAAVPVPPQAVLEVDDRTPFVGETVRFDASASVGHDEGNGRIVAYRFEFGDGAGTAWQSAPHAQYAYTGAGAKVAQVTARDGRGLEGSATLALDVRSTPPTTGEAPDLTPLGASTRPLRPALDEVVTVAVAVYNRGGSAAAAASVDVTDVRPGVGPVLVDTIRLSEPLEPNATVLLFSDPFVAVGLGTHTIVVAVRDVQPDESFTDDNDARITMVVTAPGEDGRTPRDSPFVDPLVLLLLTAAVAAFFGALAVLSRPRNGGRPGPSSAEPPGTEPPPPWPP
ncbi:MAG: PKD domain-containing protein [Methanobacteriota archaeon]